MLNYTIFFMETFIVNPKPFAAMFGIQPEANFPITLQKRAGSHDFTSLTSHPFEEETCFTPRAQSISQTGFTVWQTQEKQILENLLQDKEILSFWHQ